MIKIELGVDYNYFRDVFEERIGLKIPSNKRKEIRKLIEESIVFWSKNNE
jgi:hypothetical protein